MHVNAFARIRQQLQLSVRSYICVQQKKRETTARLLVLVLLFFLFFSTSKHKRIHTIAISNSMREQEQLHFLSCSMFADKLFSDHQLSRRASIECDSD